MGNCCEYVFKSALEDTVKLNEMSVEDVDKKDDKKISLSKVDSAQKRDRSSTKPDLLEGKYQIGKKIGSGSFATVKKVTRVSDGKQFALKIIKKKLLRSQRRSQTDDCNPDVQIITRNEVDIMRKIKHVNCCQLIEHFDTKSKLYLVVELLEGGDLFDYWHEQTFSEHHAANVVKELALGLAYLHSHGIIHRDIKPENLLYTTRTETDPGVLKITDYGLSISLQNTPSKLTTVCGTEIYMAPEMLSLEGYGEPSDLWSVGVLLYELLAGYPPFISEDPTELSNMIKEAKYDFPEDHWGGISKEARETVSGLLTKDQTKRWTTKKLLSTPWVQGHVANKALFDCDHKTRKQYTRARRILRKYVKGIIKVLRIVAVIKKLVASGVSPLKNKRRLSLTKSPEGYNHPPINLTV